MEAHQDEKVNWEELSREAQLNAACDSGAKTMIWKQDITDLPPQKPFPLEPVCMFVEGKKMTSDTRLHIRYAAGLQIVRSFFHETSRIFTDAFDEVAWPHVHRTLNEEVPRLFQVWVGAALENFPACKRKKKFWFHVRKKNRSQKNVTKNNSCHPQNR